MQFTIQRADGLHYKGSNIFNPWTEHAALATQYDYRSDALRTARELRAHAKRAGVPQEIKVVQSALELAQAFSRELRSVLTADELAEVIARNRTETSPHVCHSHDYCDANMVMFGALATLLGVRAERIKLTDDVLDLMDTAHNIAFDHRFFTN